MVTPRVLYMPPSYATHSIRIGESRTPDSMLLSVFMGKNDSGKNCGQKANNLDCFITFFSQHPHGQTLSEFPYDDKCQIHFFQLFVFIYHFINSPLTVSGDTLLALSLLYLWGNRKGSISAK